MAGTANSIITPQAITAPQGALGGTAVLPSAIVPAAGLQMLFGGAANGARVTRLSVIPVGTAATAMGLYLYSSRDAGVSVQLIDAAVSLPWTGTTATASTRTDFGYSELNPLLLGPNERLYIANGDVFWNVWTAEIETFGAPGANQIVTPQSVRSPHYVANFAACTNYVDPSATAALLFIAGPNGSRMTRLEALPAANAAAVYNVQVHRKSSFSGGTPHLFDMGLIQPITYSTTIAVPNTGFAPSVLNPVMLMGGEELWVAQSVAGYTAWSADVMDY